MSNLLKEAIVDASALRESALKNAETTIIEKYSDEVREAVSQLLEQDELSLDGEVDPVGNTEEVAANIPLAATDDLNEEEGDIPAGLPSEGEEIPVNIDLQALQEAVAALESEIEESEEIEINEEELAALFEEDDEVDVQGQVDVEEPGAVTAEEDENVEKTMEEDIDLDTLTDAIMEKLTVDMGAELSGWAGRSAESVKWEMEKELAHRRSTDLAQDLKDLKKAHEDLVFENNQVSAQTKKYKQAFQELKETLQTVNLSNARLLYTNRVLRNASLNERQKEKIVEAISKAGSVTEAKTIYQTLESTVVASPKRSPQSLGEAIGRRTSVIRATRQESTPSDPLTERMKRLAGIN
jgi:ubiquinone biosynthesis protein UbiJ